MVLVLLIFIIGQRFVLSDAVTEKQTRMRETLKIMGMRTWVNGLSYFVTHAIFSIYTAILVTITFWVLRFFTFEEGLILFLLVNIYSIAMIFMTMTVSTFFSDAKLAI